MLGQFAGIVQVQNLKVIQAQAGRRWAAAAEDVMSPIPEAALLVLPAKVPPAGGASVVLSSPCLCLTPWFIFVRPAVIAPRSGCPPLQVRRMYVASRVYPVK